MTVFPLANPAEQNIAAYATNAQVQNTAQFMARSGRGRGTATVPSVVAGVAALLAAGYGVRRRGI